jgi:hypothetical protein
MLMNNQLSGSNRLLELTSLFWFRSSDEAFISTLRKKKEKVRNNNLNKIPAIVHVSKAHREISGFSS